MATSPSSERWGFIAPDGHTVIAFAFEDLYPFSEGLAGAGVGGLYGFMDRRGDWGIAPSFTSVGVFHNGVAPAERDGKFGFIDRAGRFVVPPAFDSAQQYCDDRAKVFVGDRIGYIDRAGELVIPATYEFAESFAEGYALVHDPDDYDQKWFIDPSGRRSFGPYRNACPFSGGWAGVHDDRGWSFIDRSGRTVLRLPGDVEAERFIEGRAAARDGSDAGLRMGTSTGEAIGSFGRNSTTHSVSSTPSPRSESRTSTA